MIDLIISTLKFDFASLKKTDNKIHTSLLLIIVLGILSVSIILVNQFMTIKTYQAIDIMQQKEYQINSSGISLNDKEIINLNSELVDTGYSLDKDAIFLKKNQLITFNQLLLLSSKTYLNSENIKNKIQNSKAVYSNFVLFYVYLRESFIIFWLIILSIILSKITQNYLKKVQFFSFKQVYSWTSILVIFPIVSYTFMSFLEFRLGYRISISSMIYTLITLVYSRYLFNNITIIGEQERVNNE